MSEQQSPQEPLQQAVQQPRPGPPGLPQLPQSLSPQPGGAMYVELSPTTSSPSSGPRSVQEDSTPIRSSLSASKGSLRSPPAQAALLALELSTSASEALAAAAAALDEIGPGEFESTEGPFIAPGVGSGGSEATYGSCSDDAAMTPRGNFDALRRRSASALATGASWLLPRARSLLAEGQAFVGSQAEREAAGSDKGVAENTANVSSPAGSDNTRCTDGALQAGAEKLAEGVATPLRRLTNQGLGATAAGADEQLRRWGVGLAHLARRSMVRDQQALQRFTAPSIWSSWPEDAAAAASAAASEAGDALPFASPTKRGLCPLKYVSDATFRDALEQRDTVLVKGSWVVDRAKSGLTLPCRQMLETDCPDAVWNVTELMTHMSEGAAIILAISYSWLSREHPDPNGKHLSSLSFALQCLFESTPLKDVAIFLDWCSLYQEPRTEAEQAIFTRSLRSVHLWYVHQGTRVWALSQVPDTATAKAPFDERGWPFFELALASMVTKTNCLLDLGLLDLPAGAAEHPADWHAINALCRPRRAPPLSPEAFADSVQELRFTHDVDRVFVGLRYKDAFDEVLGTADELLFNDLGWGDDEIQQLAALLPRCSRLRKVTLHGNNPGRLSAAALAAVTPYCGALEELWLTGTPVGRNKECREWLRAAWEHSRKNIEGLKF